MPRVKTRMSGITRRQLVLGGAGQPTAADLAKLTAWQLSVQAMAQRRLGARGGGPLGNLLAAVTVGAVLVALHGLIDSVQEMIKTASAEARALLESINSDLKSLVDDLDRRFQKKLDNTFDRLDQLERRIMEDASALIDQTQKALNELQNGVFENARMLLWEADISAYENLANLPCRLQVPRFVYVSPQKLRIWVDPPEITVRGNFLDVGTPEVTIAGQSAQIIAASSREWRLRIPDSVLAGITAPGSLGIRAAPPACQSLPLRRSKVVPGKELSIAFLAEPRPQYQVSASIWCTCRQPVEQDWVFTFSQTETDCHKEVKLQTDWTLPYCDPTDPTQEWFMPRGQVAEITDVRKNCDSALGNHRVIDMKTYRVEGRLLGCWFLWFCTGNGYLAYNLRIKRAKGFKLANTQAWTHSVTVVGQKSFTFRYPSSYIPADSHSLKWQYMVTVVFPDRVENASHANPNVSGVMTRIAADGTLSVELT